MLMLGLVYLMFDVMGNTILFSFNPAIDKVSVCYMGVIITVVCQFGFLSMVFIRMYRVYAVFSAYEVYLDK